ncbi:hypothetical protein NA56DRAFT_710412 [Hyaloscypha hepaticicola]|uniref:Uncharacterized protein n=1 Tax=Hyaloscypha hepaticicola TaxID=2082293 RepID=A0A2J6PLR9_9HELO|nr:hypothetical protein NA56DRAFT_710412 [Hyaloscypha hepaticicola]
MPYIIISLRENRKSGACWFNRAKELSTVRQGGDAWGASSHPSKCCLGCIATGVDGDVDVDVDVDGWGQDEEGKVQVRGDELGLGADAAHWPVLPALLRQPNLRERPSSRTFETRPPSTDLRQISTPSATRTRDHSVSARHRRCRSCDARRQLTLSRAKDQGPRLFRVPCLSTISCPAQELINAKTATGNFSGVSTRSAHQHLEGCVRHLERIISSTARW